MKVKYIGEKSDWLKFIKNKVYAMVGESHGYWRVVDETGDDYLYSPDNFDVLSDEEYEELMKQPEYRPHKCPICSESAVGSIPTYAAVISFINCSSVPGMMS